MTDSVYVETLGCSKNQVDSEQMLGILEEAGYEIAADSESADIVIVNTCSFIHDAKVESVDAIVAMGEIKKRFLIMTGCLAQRYAGDLIEEMPEVDAFVGTTHFHEITEVIEKLKSGEGPIVWTDDIHRVLPELLPRKRLSPPHFAYIKISEGCDNRCTYCIIPHLRGKYRSRKMEDIVEEVRSLAADGVKEFILIAQDSTRYGHDLYGRYALKELLEQLSDIDGVQWIRVQYMYPDVIDRPLIETMARLDKVVNYFDIPIQHSSDRILRRMNRHTSKAEIIEVLHTIRELAQDAVIRTTVIVGFPGETEEDFEDLMSFTREYPFDRLGAFTYSQEEDTPAGRMDGQIEPEVMTERHGRLMSQQLGISEKLMGEKVGKTLEVIIEEKLEDEDVYIGRSAFDTPEVDGVVYVNTQKNLDIGAIYQVKISDHLEYDLIGEY